MQRRSFIKLTALSVAAIQAPIWITGCEAPQAVSNWQGLGDHRFDPRYRALTYGLLAPSSHNTQPWLVDLADASIMRLFIDPTRLLPAADTDQRQTWVSQGTFLEQLELGAALEGLRADVTSLPEGDRRDAPVAAVQVAEDSSIRPDPLARLITARHSNKRVYDRGRALAPDAMHDLERLTDPASDLHIRAITADDDLREVAEICTAGMDIEAGNAACAEELSRWFRLGDQAARRGDGFGLPQNGVTGIKRWIAEQFFISTDDIRDPESDFARQGVDLAREQASSAPAFFALVSGGNDRSSQLAAGRLYARWQLTATGHGVGTHPMSQVLQDLPGMSPLRRRLADVLGLNDESTVQMLVRAGYADPTTPSLRRPLAAIIRQT